MAMYTFLESYDWHGKTIPFCTHAGSGLSGTEASIRGVCEGADVKQGFAITGTVAQNNQESARASVLEEILKEYPQIEVVQIQFNYVDYDDPAVKSRKCYEVCRKFHKPVIVMEPCKGGNLTNLPEDAQKVFDELQVQVKPVMQVMQSVLLPDLFACMKAKKVFLNWNIDYYYNNVHTVNNGKASECVKCGKCEAVCPQHLHIRELLTEVAEEFEPK